MNHSSNKNLKQLIGEVVSTSMAKTVVVSIAVVKVHPLYRKSHTHHKRCYAHSETPLDFVIGDKVKIQQMTPMSKTKKWLLLGKTI